jgi:hypothetical protein
MQDTPQLDLSSCHEATVLQKRSLAYILGCFCMELDACVSKSSRGSAIETSGTLTRAITNRSMIGGNLDIVET